MAHYRPDVNVTARVNRSVSRLPPVRFVRQKARALLQRNPRRPQSFVWGGRNRPST
jgi:hypothetical protein